MQIDEILKIMVVKKDSDLHLKVASFPVFRIDGALIKQEDMPNFDLKDIESIFQQVTTPEQKVTFIRGWELISSTWYINIQIQDLEHGERHDQDRHNEGKVIQRTKGLKTTGRRSGNS